MFNIDEKFKTVDVGTPVEVTFCDNTIVFVFPIPFKVVLNTVVPAGIFAWPVTTCPTAIKLPPELGIVNVFVVKAEFVVLVKTPAAPSVFKVKLESEDAKIEVPKLTNGSTIVIFPPVNDKLDVSILKEFPPKATEVAASPLLLLSTIISPPV